MSSTNFPAETAAFCLSGGGAMGELMRAFDWGSTPLGPVESWPQSLRTAVSIILESKFPMYIGWGDEYIQFYNDGYRPILGATKHPRALGAGARETFPEIWHIIGPMFEDVRRGIASGSEDWMLPLDRYGYFEECYFTFSYSPIREESGGVGGVLVTVTETTARVLSERRLETLRDLAALASNAKEETEVWSGAIEICRRNPDDIAFALLYRAAEDGSYALEKACGLSGAGAAIAMAATSNGEAPGWPLANVNRQRQPLLVQDVRETFGEIIGPKWPEPISAALLLPIDKPGLERPYGVLIVGISPRRALDDAYRSFLTLVADHAATGISNIRAYEEEKRRVEALAELDRAKTTFFSNVSHEFRTPLTLLLGPLEDLLSRTDEHADELRLMHRNALRLLKLVNSLLDFSRLEAGRMRARYEPVDLAAATTDLASSFRSAMERAGLQFVVHCAAAPQPVYVDREMWEKIVLNLLSNAFKYTLHGKITVELRPVERAVELVVSDTGVGIEPHNLTRIFERFQRIEGTGGRSHEGSGIGLSLVHELVKLHGGTVAVESEFGKGSKFTVRIPYGRQHLPADRIALQPGAAPGISGVNPFVLEALRWLPDAPGAEVAAPETGADVGWSALPPGPRARVAIADDNADMRDYLRNLLSAEYEVECFADGETALKHVREHIPDLVVADVMMPGLDGFGLLREIREREATAMLPVVLLSARAGEEARVEGLRAGADDYLTKPFSARELLARVHATIEIAKLRREVAQREHRLRVEAEAQEQRWRELLEQAPAAIAILRGPDHVFELANAEYLRATGRKPADLVGKAIVDAMPEIKSQEYPVLLDQVYRTGTPVSGDEVIVRLEVEGALQDRYFNFVYQPYRARDESVLGVLVLAVDVTELVMSRKRVEESERQLQILANSIPQLAWMANPDGNIFWYNDRWYQVTGTTGESMRGWGWQSVHSPEHLPAVLERWKASLRTGQPFEMEFPLRKAGGGYGWFLTRVVPWRGSDGSIWRWFGTNTDITDLKRVQEALERSEARYRQLADSMPQIVWTTDERGTPEYFNARWRELARGARAGAWHELAHPDDAPRCEEAWRHSIDTKSPLELECRMTAPGRADVKWHLARAVFIAGERDGTGKWLGTLTDIEHQKRIEAELRRVNDDLRQFAYAASHDLQEPLRMISLYTEMLLKSLPAETLRDASDYEHFIRDGVRRMRELLQDLLAYTAIGGGEKAESVRRVDTAAVVETVLANLSPAIQESAAVIDVGDLPVLEGQEVHFVQLFQNLISNALKYRSAEAPRIELGSQRLGPVWRFYVKDNGIGIPPEFRERIFGVFKRLHGKEIPGTGIGLAICQRVVDRYGGRIWVEQNGRGGSVFLFEIPAQHSRPAALPQHSESHASLQ